MKDVIYEVYSNEEFNSVLDYLRESGLHIADGNYDAYYCFNNEGDSYYVGTTNGNLIYNGTNCYKNTPLIKGFKMTQTPRTFAITGSKSLLKAMEEELVGIGYNDDKSNGSTGNYLIPNTSTIKEGTNWSKQNFSELFYWSNTHRADVTFQLPQQWDECLAFCKEQLELWDKPKFKVGDWVVCTKKPFVAASVNKGGLYKIVGDNLKLDNNFKIDGFQECTDCFRFATKEEIEKAQKIVVGGHTMEIVNGKFKFGCQYITKEEVETLRKFVGSPLNFKMKVGDTEVNTELLNKILSRL